jgi:transcription-repair coupling factor (superfamily II helicase)
VLKLFNQHPLYFSVIDALNSPLRRSFVKGLSGSSHAFFIASVFQKMDKNIVCVLSEKEEAANFYSDLVSILSENHVHFFPSSFRRKHNVNDLNTANSVIRTGVLEKVSSSLNPLLIVSYPEALAEKVISRENLTRFLLRLLRKF